MDDRALRVAFVLEQHLGHRTYSENLWNEAVSADGIEPHLVRVRYAAGPKESRLPEPVAAALRGRREVKAGLASGPFDVHVFNTQVPATIGPRFARSVPYILCTDITPLQYDRMASDYGHDADQPVPLRWLKHHWNRRVFGGASAVVGWSSWVRESLINDYGVTPERCHVIPPGVDTTQFTPGPPRGDVPRILFVGGDFERKGGRELVEAFESLSADSAELIVVTKSDVPASRGMTVIRDLGPNDPRLIELFRTSDIFALPSRAEAFGIAAAEASAAGLAVIASNVGGLADIVDHDVTGLLIPPGESAPLARALEQLVRSPLRLAEMGQAARARAIRRFDAATNARSLLDLARSSSTSS